jgi:membrane-associated phospholipid phosphatase
VSLREAQRAGDAFSSSAAAAASGTATSWPHNLIRNIALSCRPRPRRHKTPPLRPVAIVAVLLCLAAVVASMFTIDAAAIAWAKSLPAWITQIFEAITNFGLAGWFLIPFGFVLVCLAVVISPALPKSARATLAVLGARFSYLFLAIALPGLFVTVVKRLIGRGRPYIGAEDNPFVYLPFHWQPDYGSMPSGHATNAAAAAIAIGAIFPRARVPMWLYATIIMASRIIVIAHHPSDVIAGALVGIVGALALRRAFAARGLVFRPDLKALPGPSWPRIAAAFGAVAARRRGH